MERTCGQSIGRPFAERKAVQVWYESRHVGFENGAGGPIIPEGSVGHIIFGSGVSQTDFAGIAPGAGVMFDSDSRQYIPIEEDTTTEKTK